ncbi:MAG: response regulator [Anaerolineae bacterium]
MDARRPGMAALPIVLLSQRADANTCIAAIELGADDYIVKPFHPREVAARVRALLRRRDLDGAAPTPTFLRVGELTIDGIATRRCWPVGRWR